MNKYNFATIKEQTDIFNNATWYLKTDYKYNDVKDDGQIEFIESLYSDKQRFGYTDYKDHRKDTLESIKGNIIRSITGSQRLQLYKDDDCKILNDKIVCWGYLGGISAEFI